MPRTEEPWAFRTAFDAGRLLSRLAQGCFSVAAGVLHRSQLHAISQRYWDTLGPLSPDSFDGFMRGEREVYDLFVRPRDRVLIVGAGTGRDAYVFAEAGHEVVGVEPAARAITALRPAAARPGTRLSFITGNIEDVALPGTFDAVVFSWFTYSYIQGGAVRVRVLQRLVRHLNAGARIFISYIDKPEAYRGHAARLSAAAARLARSDWVPEPGDGFRPLISGERTLIFVHTFDPEAIEREVETARYRVLYHYRDAQLPTLVIDRPKD